MKIRIVNDTGIGNRTKVFAEDGTELTQYLPITEIRIKAGEIITAHLEVIVDKIEMYARPDLNENDLAAIAKASGYRIEKDEALSSDKVFYDE